MKPNHSLACPACHAAAALAATGSALTFDDNASCDLCEWSGSSSELHHVQILRSQVIRCCPICSPAADAILAAVRKGLR